MIGDRDFKAVAKVKWGHKGGVLIKNGWYASKKRKRHQGCRSTEKRSCQDMVSRQPSPRGSKRPQGKTDGLIP